MKFDKLTNREQVLIFIVILTFVGGGYGLLRFVPELKKQGELQASIVKNKATIKSPNIPEEPFDDIDDLKEKITQLEAEFASIEITLENAEKSLAPTDSQEMVLKISEAARTAGVRVTESVPYLVQKKDGSTAAGQANTPKLSKRAQRRANRAASKVTTTNKGAAVTPATGSMPKEGELIYRLVNDLETSRPFQRITVEGSFADLQSFIQALRAMPWQAAIVKLDIDVAIQTPPPGMPQPLTVRMLVSK